MKNYENSTIRELKQKIDDYKRQLLIEQKKENEKHEVSYTIFKNYHPDTYLNGLYDNSIINDIRSLTTKICYPHITRAYDVKSGQYCDQISVTAYRDRYSNRTESQKNVHQQMINDMYEICAKYMDKVLADENEK